MDPNMQQPQAPMQQPPVQQSGGPVRQVNTSRGVLKTILLSIVTFGIYGIYVYYTIVEDLNLIASRYDGKSTMNFLIATLLLGPITFGIFVFIYMHNLFNRIGAEMTRRGLENPISAGTFWIFGILLSWTIVCPFICFYKLLDSMNRMGTHYNTYG